MEFFLSTCLIVPLSLWDLVIVLSIKPAEVLFLLMSAYNMMPSYTDRVQYAENEVLLCHKRLWGWICHHSFEWWIPKVLWHHCFLLYSQRLTLTLDNAENGKQKSHVAEMRERIIKRAALEFRDGMYGILLTKCNESPSSKLRHTEQWLYIWCCKWRLIFIPLWSSFPKDFREDTYWNIY